MRSLPLEIGPIHFVGIGGIGMSGIAEVLGNLGYRVRGSDLAENANTRRLRALGIEVALGHREENLADAQVVVVSSAVKAGNPEVMAARARLLPIVRRAEMLGELMRLRWSIAVGGTHGKTTTTSLIATVLDGAGYDPTVINGGIIEAYGTNARLGAGDWMVVESDESDGSFMKLPATIAVVTNIDPEHMEHYGSFDEVRKAYATFVENIPFYGFAALCIDHPEVQGLIGRVVDRRIVPYGFSPQAAVRGVNLRRAPGGSLFDVAITDRASGSETAITDVRLPMLGRHNVSNALAAIAVAHELGVDGDTIRRALGGFKGVKRRFSRTGMVGGVTIVDDYGHHPVEIAAVLRAAREAYDGRIVAVVQPHRFTRLHDLFDQFCTCFNDADMVIVADVYAAGEEPIAGADRAHLVEGLRTRGHRHVDSLDAPADLAPLVARLTQVGDVVICLGAGTITQWAHALPGELAALGDGRARAGAGA
ncbi:MAG: UDP-N-acetylmuramate--L-alanine ligase [Alphaproteobacteria bacterium]|nr:UDP-N-acetylmuramate--L-alanine ligase [Alphaproteobacteria bacterium]